MPTMMSFTTTMKTKEKERWFFIFKALSTMKTSECDRDTWEKEEEEEQERGEEEEEEEGGGGRRRRKKRRETAERRRKRRSKRI